MQRNQDGCKQIMRTYLVMMAGTPPRGSDADSTNGWCMSRHAVVLAPPAGMCRFWRCEFRGAGRTYHDVRAGHAVE